MHQQMTMSIGITFCQLNSSKWKIVQLSHLHVPVHLRTVTDMKWDFPTLWNFRLVMKTMNIFNSVFALYSFYTWLVSSKGRHLSRPSKYIASSNASLITCSCQYQWWNDTYIQVQEVISIKLVGFKEYKLLTW